ncbi:MAG: family transporter protein [Marmoricola sp.]|nr:family transporter protein [Marmoricola sp.]
MSSVKSVRSAWEAELVKILTVRGLRVGAALAAIAIPLASLLVASTGGLGSADTITSGAASGSVLGLLAFGAWAAADSASEYVHETITVSLSTVPRRPVLFGAKIAAVATVSGVGALLAAVLSLLLVQLATPSGTHQVGSPATLLSIVLAAVAVAVVGASVGMLVRTSTASIAIVAAAVLLPKAAAGLLGGLQPWVVGASPGTVITQSVRGAQLASDQTYPGGTVLAALSMLLVAGIVVVGSGYAFARRDG